MVNWSEKDLKKYYKKNGIKKAMKPRKYNNKKVMLHGLKFDSIKERNRYLELKKKETKGEIERLELQPEFLLQERFRDNNGKLERAITYKADFMYIINGLVYVEDVKSAITKKEPRYILKRKLFKKKFPDYKFIEN